MGLYCSKVLLENLGGKAYLKLSEFGLTIFCMKIPVIMADDQREIVSSV
jgi:hypothetical protein